MTSLRTLLAFGVAFFLSAFLLLFFQAFSIAGDVACKDFSIWSALASLFFGVCFFEVVVMLPEVILLKALKIYDSQKLLLLNGAWVLVYLGYLATFKYC